MNQVFKVVYNHSLKVFQVVGELTKNKSKVSSKSLFPVVNIPFSVDFLKLTLLSGCLFSVFNVCAYAAVVPSEDNVSVITSDSSGLTVINIAKPDGSGLSHNKYSDFNTSESGTIFNNSGVDHDSYLGGAIKGNSNFDNGQGAAVILNEVNGIHSSNLQGPLEVSGNKAALIIANPNGIQVNGVSTINATGLTLSTGNILSIEGQNVNFDISKGNITIRGNGLNTNGLSYFDVVAKSIALYGNISGIDSQGNAISNTDIKLIAGENEYSTANRNVTAKGSTGTGIAIDGNLAGSVYGNNVTLISSDSGAGVRHLGAISSPNDILIDSAGSLSLAQASADNMNFSAAGDIDTVQMNAKRDLTLHSQKGNVQLLDADVGGKVDAKADDGELQLLSVNADNIETKANNITFNKVKATQSLSAESAGAVTADAIQANEVNFKAEGNITLGKKDNGQPQAVNAGTLLLNTHSDLYVNKNIYTDTLSIQAKNAELDRAAFFINGNDEQNHSSVNVSNNLIIKGNIFGEDSHGNRIDGSRGEVVKGKATLVDSTGNVIEGVLTSDSGIFVNQGGLDVHAGNLSNEGGAIKSNAGGVNLEADKAFVNNGIVISEGELSINAKTINNNFSLVSAGDKGKVNVSADVLFNEGNISTGNHKGDSVHLTIGDKLLNKGNIESNAIIISDDGLLDVINTGGDASLLANSVNINANSFNNEKKASVEIQGVDDISSIEVKNTFFNDADIVDFSSDELIIKAGNVIQSENAFLNKSFGDLTIHADTDFSNGGIINVETLNASAGHNLNNSGDISVVGGALSAGDNLINSGKIGLKSRKDSELRLKSGQDITNNGDIYAFNRNSKNPVNLELSFSADGNIHNNGTITQTKNDTGSKDDVLTVNLHAGNTVNNSGVVNSKWLNVNADNFNNLSSASVNVTDNAIFTISDTFSNHDGNIGSLKDLTIETGKFKNNNNKIIAGNNAILNVTGNDGLVVTKDSQTPIAAKNLNITANNIIVNSEIQNPGNISINATVGDVTNKGLIAGNNNINIAADNGSINNIGVTSQSDKSASIWAANDVNMNSKNKIYNGQGGNIYSGGNLVIKTESLINDAGKILSKKNISIIASSIFNTSKVINYDVGSDKGDKLVGNHVGEGGNSHKDRIEIEGLKTPNINNADIVKGEIHSGGDITVSTSGQLNEGLHNSGIFLADKNLDISGNISNEGVSFKYNTNDYFNQNDDVHINVLIIKYHEKCEVIHNTCSPLYEPKSYKYSSLGSMLDDGKGFNSLRNIPKTDPFFEIMMADALGADWRDQSNDELAKRWGNYKNSSEIHEVNIQISQSVIAGKESVNLHGGTIENGGDWKKENLSPDKQNVKIGDADVETIKGSIDTQYVAPSKDIDAVMSEMGNNALYSKTEVSFNGKPVDINNAFSKKPSVNVNTSNKNNNGYDDGLIRHYFYETNVSFIDQNDYYGSDYFLNQMGLVPNAEYYSAGDNYFETNLIIEQINNQSDSYFSQDSRAESEIVKQMMDDALGEADKQNLTVGVPLTAEQQGNLQNDIVWYEWNNVDGVNVLTPHVYLSSETKEKNEKLASQGNALITSQGDVSIDTDNNNFVSNNGSVIGNNVTLSTGEGDVIIVNDGGAHGGIKANEDVYIDGKNVYIEGGNNKGGNSVTVVAENDLTIAASMKIDENGNLVKRDENQIEAGGEVRKGEVNLDSKNLTSEGAAISSNGGDLNIIADDVTLNSVKEVSSNAGESHFNDDEVYKDEDGNKYVADGSTDSAHQESIALSKGSEWNAGSLNIHVKNDFTETGSTINANNSNITVDGNFTSKASENFAHSKDKSNTTKQKTFSFRDSETSTETQDKIHTNSQLNLGNGEVNVGNTLDLGGADINRGRKDNNNNDTLKISADKIQTTKYKDEHTLKEKSSYLSFGGNAGTTGVVKSVQDMGETQSKKEQGMEENSKVKAGQLSGLGSQAVFGDTFGGQAGAGISWGSSSSEEKTVSDNRNNFDGNIELHSKNDVDLNNVSMNGGKTVTIDAGGDVNINAGVKTTERESKSKNNSITFGGNAGVGAGGAAVGASVGYSHSSTKENSSSKNYDNSSVTADNVNIKSKKDLNIAGGNIGGNEVNLDIGNNVNIESVQDEYHGTKHSEGGGFSVGVSAGVTPLSPFGGVVKPTVSASGYSNDSREDSKITEKQSGIDAGSLNAKVGNDVNLTGSGIISDNHDINIGGNVNAHELSDERDITGSGFSMGGGINKFGLPSATGSGHYDDEEHYQAENHTTISMGNGSATVGGGVNGDINTDKEHRITVVKDQKIAGGDFDVTVSVPTKLPKSPTKAPTSPTSPKPSTPKPSTSDSSSSGSSTPKLPTLTSTETSTPPASGSSTPKSPASGSSGSSTSKPPKPTPKPPKISTTAGRQTDTALGGLNRPNRPVNSITVDVVTGKGPDGSLIKKSVTFKGSPDDIKKQMNGKIIYTPNKEAGNFPAEVRQMVITSDGRIVGRTPKPGWDGNNK